MKSKVIYQVCVPSLCLNYEAKNRNELKKIVAYLQDQKLSYYVKQIYLNLKENSFKKGGKKDVIYS